jgi:5'-deoxynucleotidase YfbR-like HD superfamily hydrolase
MKVNITTLSPAEVKGFEEPYMETYSGKRVYFGRVSVDDILIEDIAHSLSQICRFTGHTKKFYSVAQHSVMVSDAQATLAEKRAGLLHDATECYLNDLSSPLKAYLGLGKYKELEDAFHEVINEKYNVNGGMTANIKKADLSALFTEKRDTLNFPNSDWGWGDEIRRFEKTIKPKSCKKAKKQFLKRFKELFPEEAKLENVK